MEEKLSKNFVAHCKKGQEQMLEEGGGKKKEKVPSKKERKLYTFSCVRLLNSLFNIMSFFGRVYLLLRLSSFSKNVA